MKLILLFMMICPLFLSVGAVAAQEVDLCWQLGGYRIDSQCRLNFDAKFAVEYPIDLMPNELIANTIDPFVKENQDGFFQWLASKNTSFITGPVEGPYEFRATYEEFHYSTNIVSLVFTIHEYYGPPHEQIEFQTYMFDLEVNKLLTLNDLFLPDSNPADVLEPLVETALAWELRPAEKRGVVAPYYPDEYQNFALTEDSLMFYFPPYSLMAGYGAPVHISIPLSQLSSVLKPEFAS